MKNLLLSSRIKECCKTRGLSVKFLLESCDMNRNTIYDLEKKGSFPTSDKIAKIADYLDCSVDYLLGRTDVPEPNKGNNHSQLILTAAHSGDEINTKPFTPEQEAYIDKLIEKKKNE